MEPAPRVGGGALRIYGVWCECEYEHRLSGCFEEDPLRRIVRDMNSNLIEVNSSIVIITIISNEFAVVVVEGSGTTDDARHSRSINYAVRIVLDLTGETPQGADKEEQVVLGCERGQESCFCFS